MVTYQQRYSHFSKLLRLCNKYGGYLNINWCANRWSAPLNPIAMLKTNSEWRSACEKYGQNLQIEEKYTQGSFIADVESEVLGFYLSGYCGNFGVRYDETGWTDGTENKDYYHQITGMPIHLERMVLNGATVIDGPELIWQDDFKETWGGVKDSDGYSCRNWETRDQYVNDTLYFFRKVIDGSIRIPTRKEVIDRTKVVVIQDLSSGDDHAKYSTYPSLFEGLYRMNGDGNLWDNTNPYKSTGRYPTIPTVYALRDDLAKSFKVQIKQSEIAKRWSTISAKQDEFNKLFASDYYGNCYAARYENSWVAYNPNKKGDNCGAVLSLKYNTCKEMDVNFNANGNALINEYSDHIDIYTNNFNEDEVSTLKTDTFKIIGCSAKPTYTAKDTGLNQTKSQFTESYSDGTYTLAVKHNGPVEISIKCSGTSTGKLTSYTKANVKAPSYPGFYTGIRQYEGEFFDTKNVEGNVANACGSGVTGIQGQGFLKYGKNANAAVKDTVRTQKAGTFKLKLRYSVTSDVNCIDLYVNGSKVKTLSLPKGSSYSDWKTVTENITLKAGDNKIEFKSNAALPASLYIDNFTVEGTFGDGTPTIPDVNIEPINGTLIKNLLVKDTENYADWSVQTGFKEGTIVFGDRAITASSVPDYLKGVEYIRTACDSKGMTEDEAMFTAGDDIFVYLAMDSRVSGFGMPWLEKWTKTEDTITLSNDLILEIFKLDAKKGAEVLLGTNSGNGQSVNYVVLAKKQKEDPVVTTTTTAVTTTTTTTTTTVRVDIKPINGTLIKNLIVKDAENYMDWSVQTNFKEGDTVFGDRSIAADSAPDYLNGAEYIRTACDSKLMTEDEATFTAGDDIFVYLAMDSRVSGFGMPWLEKWTKTDDTMSLSGDLTLEIFKLSAKKGDEILLGTNSGNGQSVNYVVLAKKQKEDTVVTTTTVTTNTTTTKTSTTTKVTTTSTTSNKVSSTTSTTKTTAKTTSTSAKVTTTSKVTTTTSKPDELLGDLNNDKKVNTADIVLLQKFLVKKSKTVSGNADLNGDGKVNVYDLIILKRIVLKA